MFTHISILFILACKCTKKMSGSLWVDIYIVNGSEDRDRITFCIAERLYWNIDTIET